MICDLTNYYIRKLTMAQKRSTTNLSTLPFSFMNQQDPMLSMLKWLCKQILVLFKPNLSDYPFPTVSKLHPPDKKQTSTKDCLNYYQKKKKDQKK